MFYYVSSFQASLNFFISGSEPEIKKFNDQGLLSGEMTYSVKTAASAT